MLLKMCRRCKKIIISTSSYCDKCSDIVEKSKEESRKANQHKYNSKRDSKYKQFYNSKEWLILKDKKMQDQKYRCERCNGLATEVHHIIPIQTDEGWILRLTYKNLKCVCIDCHNFYHNRFQKRKSIKKYNLIIAISFR